VATFTFKMSDDHKQVISFEHVENPTVGFDHHTPGTCLNRVSPTRLHNSLTHHLGLLCSSGVILAYGPAPFPAFPLSVPLRKGQETAPVCAF